MIQDNRGVNHRFFPMKMEIFFVIAQMGQRKRLKWANENASNGPMKMPQIGQ